MHTENEETNLRIGFRIRVLGILSALLVLGYAIILQGGLLFIPDALIAIVTSLILVGIFALYIPRHVEKQIDDDIKVGRLFFGSGIGLAVAFIFGVVTLLMMGVHSFSDIMTTRRIEALFFITYSIFVFISAGLSFYLGYRYYLLGKVEEPKVSFFEKGGFFIAVGIPCLGVSVLLFILASWWYGPITDILTLVGFILMVIFFLIFVFSAFLDVSIQAKKREAEESTKSE